MEQFTIRNRYILRSNVQRNSVKESQTMKANRTPRNVLFVLIAAVLLLAACGPAATPAPTQEPAQPTVPAPAPSPTAAPEIVVTEAPAATAEPTGGTAGDISVDLGSLAQDMTVETVPANPASAGGPPWEVAPEYRRLTLQGYPIANHMHKPQIFVYPVAGLAPANEALGIIASDLQALLQSQQAGANLPFLPPFNASQVFHAQVKYLDFKSGKGVRFLTQFDQAFLPINNYELFYTFQGMTGDGKYYVAAILPVTHPDLPATNQVSEAQMQELSDFPAYLSKTVAMLEGQPASSFTPDLSQLDALVGSIEVK